MSDDLARGTVKKKRFVVNPRKNGIKRVLCERANDLSLVMNVFVNV